MGGEAEKQQGAAAAAVAGRDKSSFAVTCGLLSQYLKEKKGGLHGIGMAAPPPLAVEGVFRPLTTMNLLSSLDEPNHAATAEPRPRASDSVELSPDEEKARQLTIFYGGRVVVFDNFPATKVKDLLQMVNGGHAGDKASSSNAAPQSLTTPSHNLSDMPIARRNSLHRFLEKRKGRIIAKAPYQVDTSVEASNTNKQATGEKPRLGFGQEVTVKQEI